MRTRIHVLEVLPDEAEMLALAMGVAGLLARLFYDIAAVEHSSFLYRPLHRA
ncbi:MAG: hypothetical protein A4E54_02713 [Pelotomaculum sp. PtaB.Bin117]|nr:MAG: hypothetical protein A4E54_02713 [Pelotomaculum sp. PtaB.Bin117]OPY63782.1 MAG: hypothetical protein A4E56_00317 [Pelotomaculum sp. PtaU1.Bin065]